MGVENDLNKNLETETQEPLKARDVVVRTLAFVNELAAMSQHPDNAHDRTFVEKITGLSELRVLGRLEADAAIVTYTSTPAHEHINVYDLTGSWGIATFKFPRGFSQYSFEASWQDGPYRLVSARLGSSVSAIRNSISVVPRIQNPA